MNEKTNKKEEPIIINEERVIINSENSSKKRDYILPASILIAALIIAGSLIYLAKSGNSSNSGNSNDNSKAQVAAVAKKAPANDPRDVILGDPKAPVTIIEYGDYQCTYCGEFYKEVQPQLVDSFVTTGKAKLVFRNYTVIDLMSGGKESQLSAEAAECAKDQQKYWPFHDALYKAEVADGKEANGNLKRDLFIKIAGDLEMDVGAFTGCFDSHKYADTVKSQTAQAQKDGISGTPTIFINGEQFQKNPFSSALFETISALAAKK